MSQIKIVPKTDPNADGEWIEVPADLSVYRRWRHMAEVVEPHIPPGYFVAQIGSRPPEARLRSISDILKGKA